MMDQDKSNQTTKQYQELPQLWWHWESFMTTEDGLMFGGLLSLVIMALLVAIFNFILKHGPDVLKNMAVALTHAEAFGTVMTVVGFIAILVMSSGMVVSISRRRAPKRLIKK